MELIGSRVISSSHDVLRALRRINIWGSHRAGQLYGWSVGIIRSVFEGASAACTSSNQCHEPGRRVQRLDSILMCSLMSKKKQTQNRMVEHSRSGVPLHGRYAFIQSVMLAYRYTQYRAGSR